jgi:hypothetical protein
MQMLQIKADGTVQMIDNNEYQDINTAVGGNIEAVGIDEENVMYCNEEGKNIALPPNYIATTLFQSRFGKVDVICGDVVIVGVGERQENGFNDGESHEPTAKIVQQVQEIVQTLQPRAEFIRFI